MTILFLILYAYGGTVMMCVASDFGRRNDPTSSLSFVGVLLSAALIFFLWPLFIRLAIAEWNRS